jgi:ERCC4-related helicase
MRTHQRLSFDIHMKFAPLAVNPAGDDLTFESICKNLSVTGVFFETKRDPDILNHLKVGTLIWVSFPVEKFDGLVRVQCEIRRIHELPRNKAGFGAMFINLSSKYRQAIDLMIK